VSKVRVHEEWPGGVGCNRKHDLAAMKGNRALILEQGHACRCVGVQLQDRAIGQLDGTAFAFASQQLKLKVCRYGRLGQ
jgi:hypothetical protein